MTDEELIQSIIEGDDGAFGEIVRRYEPQVARTVIGMLGNCPEAEDVGQETFIRLYRGLKYFRGQSSLGTYLTRIALNLSLNEIKRRKRRSRIFFHRPSEEMYNVPDEKTSRHPDRLCERRMVRQAIGKLEPKLRAVIVLRLIDGYSTKETAEILSIPLGTVLSRLSRAQMKLKEILTPSITEGVQ